MLEGSRDRREEWSRMMKLPARVHKSTCLFNIELAGNQLIATMNGVSSKLKTKSLSIKHHFISLLMLKS
jgi:hypothetical protein